MPLYEYQCKSCNDVIEVLVRSQADKAVCPECGHENLERVLSVPAAPAIKSKASLPVAGAAESCGAPRCCGGGCQV